jgi:hypothetical protein
MTQRNAKGKNGLIYFFALLAYLARTFLCTKIILSQRRKVRQELQPVYNFHKGKIGCRKIIISPFCIVPDETKSLYIILFLPILCVRDS